ncbi:MAG: DUF3142 domain-containing protein [Sphingorhabdus sp.]
MRLMALFFALLWLSACQKAEPVEVDARDYDAFWLWAGVEPQPVLDKAKTLYILAAEIRGGSKAGYVSLRPAVPQVRHAKIWIVYRVESLDWADEVMPRIRRDIAVWLSAGNDIAGVQIDFDAATRGLSGYTAFLKQLRAGLPPDTHLSITGLLDWSSGGDSPALNVLTGTVDEVVLQTYQGRQTIPGYTTYLRQLDRLQLPFKIGLVQNGQWTEPSHLRQNTNFRGYVVFLLNPK